MGTRRIVVHLRQAVQLEGGHQLTVCGLPVTMRRRSAARAELANCTACLAAAPAELEACSSSSAPAASSSSARQLTCGCCTGGCVCWAHQDAGRGVPVATCAAHLEAGR